MGGSPSLPTASTPGYGTITRNGHTFVGCDCVIAFVEAGEQLGLALGLIHECVDIVQLTGDADASGGTHSLGAAFDVRQCSQQWSRHVWREMGAAFWPRVGEAWEGNEHGHGFIDCPHDARVEYQRLPYWRGYSGLGQAKTGPYAGMWGYGSKDPDPWRPTTRRTWREGIAWAQAQTKALLIQQEDVLASIDELRALLREEVPNIVWGAPLLNHDPDPTDDKPATTYAARSYEVMANWRAAQNQIALASVQKVLASIAGKVGVDIDEKALAAEIVSSLAPTVHDAVLAAGQPAAVADAVVAKLGAALTPPAA